MYWPIKIKYTIQWFPFLSILEHNASNSEADISLLPSLLIVFEMIQMCLLYYEHNEEDNFMEAIAIKCTNFQRSTGLYLKDKIVEEMFSQFVLNSVLHHVVL